MMSMYEDTKVFRELLEGFAEGALTFSRDGVLNDRDAVNPYYSAALERIKMHEREHPVRWYALVACTGFYASVADPTMFRTFARACARAQRLSLERTLSSAKSDL